MYGLWTPIWRHAGWARRISTDTPPTLRVPCTYFSYVDYELPVWVLPCSLWCACARHQGGQVPCAKCEMQCPRTQQGGSCEDPEMDAQDGCWSGRCSSGNGRGGSYFTRPASYRVRSDREGCLGPKVSSTHRRPGFGRVGTLAVKSDVLHLMHLTCLRQVCLGSYYLASRRAEACQACDLRKLKHEACDLGRFILEACDLGKRKPQCPGRE
jgi:hypothetical protein